MKTQLQAAIFLTLIGSISVLASNEFNSNNNNPPNSIVVTQSRDLSFGSVKANDGGTVNISPYGMRSSTGSVDLVSQKFNHHPGIHLVNGIPGVSYDIDLPISATVSSGANIMYVEAFYSNPYFTDVFSQTGEGTIDVGATLYVGKNQPKGVYTGSYMLSTIYSILENFDLFLTKPAYGLGSISVIVE